MSQIIGIVCKDCIIIACESQITLGNLRSLDGVKLSLVQFKNTAAMDKKFYADALIAEAGDTANSSKAVYYIQQMAKDNELNSVTALSDIVETCMNRMRHEVLKSYQKRKYSEEEQDAIFSNHKNNFELMFAHYYMPPAPLHLLAKEVNQCLWKCSLANPQPERFRQFAASGSASDIAFFELNEFTGKELHFKDAAGIAIDILDRITNTEVSCGGRMQLGIVSPASDPPMAGLYGDVYTERILNKVRHASKEVLSKYQDAMKSAMQKIHNEDVEKELNRRREKEENRQREFREAFKRLREAVKNPIKNAPERE